ncbi:MAG: alpha/beta hydrolase family protein [Opitutaceae bacterium]
MNSDDPRSEIGALENYVLDYAWAGSQLKDHVYERSRRCFARGDAERDALTAREAVIRRQTELREFFLGSIGGLPGSDTPLNAQVTGSVAGAGFAIETILFESRPRHYVTANLYLPEGRTGPAPGVLFLCGHHLAGKQAAEYQIVCQTLVRAGLVVLAQDPIGQGERLSYFEPETGETRIPGCVLDHDHAGVQCRIAGDSLARYFVHDAMRGIDYLLTRGEVDPARIGVTGNSGGGTQTSLLMLADPRIAAAAPCTFIMSRDSYQRTGQAQDAEQIWPGFTRAGYDHEDILLAMAPKPVCVLAVTDDFFPIEGTRRTVERCRRLWGLFGAEEALELVEDASLHVYTPALAQAAARFFARHLPRREAEFPAAAPFPEARLNATKSGQVRADFPSAEFVFEANLERCRAAEASRQALPADERKSRAFAWLRAQVFRDREVCPANPRRIERGLRLGGLAVEIAFWWTQPGLANLGVLFRPPGRGMPVTLALWDGGTRALAPHETWIRAECAAGRAVLALSLSGTGPLRPDPINGGGEHAFYGTFHKLVDDLDWLGDSLAALRTYEVVRALDALEAWPDLSRRGVRIHARGRAGLPGWLAAAVDPRVAGCEWKDRFRYADLVRSRFYDSMGAKELLLPGVLNHFDLDEE